MPEDFHPVKADRQPVPRTTEEDGLSSKLWRETCLVTRGLVQGMRAGAVESYHDPLGTALRVGEIAALNFLLARSHGGGLLGFTGKLAGSALTVNFAQDVLIGKRWMPAWQAVEDTWLHKENYERNAAVMEKTLGRLAFDTVLASTSALANPKLYELLGKRRAEIASRARIRSAYEPDAHGISIDKFVAEFEPGSQPAIRSAVLDWLAEAKPALRPKAFKEARASAPVDKLGLAEPLDLGAWAPEERRALVAELKRMAGFDPAHEKHSLAAIKLLKMHTRDWAEADLRPLRAQVSRADHEAQVAATKFEQAVRQVPTLKDVDFQTVSSQWPELRKHPAIKERFDLAQDTHSAYLSLCDQLAPQYERRGQALTRCFADLASARNLPSPQVIVDDLIPAGGMYYPGRARIGVTGQEAAQPGLSALLVDKLLHEFTHFERDVLSIRRLADDLDIGRKASFAQRQRLSEAYGAAFDQQLDERFLDAVLKVRRGRPLTPDELAISLKVDSSIVKYDQSQSGPKLEKYTHDYRLLLAERNCLERPGASLDLALRLLDADAPSHHALLSGKPTLPAVKDLLADARKIRENPALVVAWKDEQAKQALSEQLNMAAILRWRESRPPFNTYISSDFEQDAWANGLLAHILARASGVAGQPG
jgi:hypothetical protein